MKIKIPLIFIFLVLLANCAITAQDNYWKKSTDKSVLNLTSSEKGNSQSKQFYELNIQELKRQLFSASDRTSQKKSSTEIVFPNPEGQLERFSVYETQILSTEISGKFPEIKTYIGFGLDSKGETCGQRRKERGKSQEGQKHR